MCASCIRKVICVVAGLVAAFGATVFCGELFMDAVDANLEHREAVAHEYLDPIIDKYGGVGPFYNDRSVWALPACDMEVDLGTCLVIQDGNYEVLDEGVVKMMWPVD